VDVAGALADRVHQDEVHQLDDRRVLGRLEVDLLLLLLGDVHLLVGLAEDLVERGALLRVVAIDGLADARLRGHHRLDVVPGRELEVVDRIDVRRVGHRHDQRLARAIHRDDQVLLRNLLLHQLDDLRVDLEVLQVDRRDAVLLAEEVGELVLLDRSDLDQGGADPGAVLLLLLLRFAELLDRDQVFPDEQFTEAAGGHAFALPS
jgi:hypothetical protein